MIGIIGGNGVAATNSQLQLIESRIVEDGGFRDAHHLEMIVWQATQVPSRSMFLEEEENAFSQVMLKWNTNLKNTNIKIV